MTKKVLFNASVIIAGLYSPKGGSAKLLKLAEKDKINGVISEIIYDEVLRHKDVLKMSASQIEKKIKHALTIYRAPKVQEVNKFKNIVIDEGDAHVLASYKDLDCNILVSLDKKHILSLKDKIKNINIYSPAEFIQIKTGKAKL